MCTDGWEQGWHERNSGNLTYRMKESEAAECGAFPGPWAPVDMGVAGRTLRGSTFSPPAAEEFFHQRCPGPGTLHRHSGDKRRGTHGASSGGLEGAQSPPASSPASL